MGPSPSQPRRMIDRELSLAIDKAHAQGPIAPLDDLDLIGWRV